jgi:transposase InsO family protein
MTDPDKADALATERWQYIAPLVEDHVDAALRRQRAAQIAAQTGLSDRTLRRWVAQYQAGGLAGLRPRARTRSAPAAIPPAVLEAAIDLRREAPHRSVRQLIQVLEWEGQVAPGTLKRSTLQEQLAARGYSARQLRQYAAPGVAARRFHRRHRNALWQADIKYGPRLPGRAGQAPQPTYLSAIIDDATRYIVHAAWYPTQDETIVLESLRTAIRRYGVPARLYMDNGKQYRAHQLTRVAARLGIRLVYTKPYAPESKGKVERFNRVVDDFLAEVRLDHPTTLEAFNAAWDVWLAECYQTKPHRALPDARHPEAAYRGDPEPLRFVDVETLTAAFQRVARRKVDKTGCVSFQGQPYEVGVTWVGQTVDVVYDPADISTVTIEVPGTPPWTAQPAVVGEHTGPRPALPDALGPTPPTHSRVLAAARQRQAARAAAAPPAVSFRGLTAPRPSQEGGEADV